MRMTNYEDRAFELHRLSVREIIYFDLKDIVCDYDSDKFFMKWKPNLKTLEIIFCISRRMTIIIYTEMHIAHLHTLRAWLQKHKIEYDSLQFIEFLDHIHTNNNDVKIINFTEKWGEETMDDFIYQYIKLKNGFIPNYPMKP